MYFYSIICNAWPVISLQETMYKTLMKLSNAVSHESFIYIFCWEKAAVFVSSGLNTNGFFFFFREFPTKTHWRSGCCVLRLLRRLWKSSGWSQKLWRPLRALSTSCRSLTGYKNTNTCTFHPSCRFRWVLKSHNCVGPVLHSTLFTFFISSSSLSLCLRYALRWRTPVE